MDLFAPFLSATKILVDTASLEDLEMLDTETTRYIWHGNDYLLLVLSISKGARVGHMRFLLRYALTEFIRTEVPKNADIETVLSKWTGAPGSFKRFEIFLNELVQQFEVTDESLIAGKAMDCLAVYSHLFKVIMKVKLTKKKRETLVKIIRERTSPLFETEPALQVTLIDGSGVDVLAVNPYDCSYKNLRDALEEMLRIIADAAREIATEESFRDMIFTHAMPYVKRDIERLQLYFILDDVIRYLF